MRTYSFVNYDAAESFAFERQLEKLRSKVYEVRYPDLVARSLIPDSPDPAQDGDEKIRYRQEDIFGEMKSISKKAHDVPLVEVKGEEFEQKIQDYGLGFKISLGEARKAARLGMDLNSKQALAARKLSERKVDEILALGDAKAGLKGLLNHSAVTAADVVNGGSGTAWTTKTAEQILEDMNEPVRAIQLATKGIFGMGGLTMLLPNEQYTLIAQKRVPDLNMTVLQFFLSSNKFVTDIVPWWRLDSAASGLASDRMVVYPRDPEVLTKEIPSEFEFLAPQEKGYNVYVPGRLVCAGVIVTQPKAMVYRGAI